MQTATLRGTKFGWDSMELVLQVRAARQDPGLNFDMIKLGQQFILINNLHNNIVESMTQQQHLHPAPSIKCFKLYNNAIDSGTGLK